MVMVAALRRKQQVEEENGEAEGNGEEEESGGESELCSLLAKADLNVAAAYHQGVSRGQKNRNIGELF